MASLYEPEGPFITGTSAQAPDIKDADLVGTHVTLTPLRVEHAEALYEAVGGEENAHLYKYLTSSPYFDLPSFTKSIEAMPPTGLFPFLITKHGKAAGIICYLNIVPGHRSIEIGNIIFGLALQRTTAATEAMFLMMRHAFEDLHYLRVEWRANSFNEPSKRAALRLGFVHEGVFRKHMIIKGRGRDSWWSSVVDEEWFGAKEGEAVGVKGGLEVWLGDDNFDGEGGQKRKLEDIRAGM